MKQITIISILLFSCYYASSQELLKLDSTKLLPNKLLKNDLKVSGVFISGVIQVHYLNEFNTNGDSIRDPDGFRILRARLTAKGKVNKFTSYQLMIDPRAPELGGVLRDAFMAFSLTKKQSLRVGQQKTQFGYENRQSVTELYVVNRAEMSDGLARGLNLRDIGLGLIGSTKLNETWKIENAFTFTNGAKMNVQGPFDFSNTKNGFGRIGLQYKKKEFECSLGFSAAMGGIKDLGNDLVDPLDDVFIRFKRIGTDLQIENKWFFLAGEYAMGTEKIQDTISGNPFGYYGIIAVKSKWNIGPLFRVDAFEDEYQRLTAGLYYGKPKDKLRVLINYEFRGKILDIPTGHDDRLYIQFQIRF